MGMDDMSPQAGADSPDDDQGAARGASRTSFAVRLAILALNAVLLVTCVVPLAAAAAFPGSAPSATPVELATPGSGTPLVTVPARNIPSPHATPTKHQGGQSGPGGPTVPRKTPTHPPAATSTPVPIDPTATPTPQIGGG